MRAQRIINLSLMVMLLALSQSFAQKAAPNFKLSTQEGKVVELAALKGKIVVLNFWATWCGPCRKEIPGFMEVYKHYKEKGLEIVGVSLDRDGWEAVGPYVEQAKINYPVVVGNRAMVEAYGGIDAIPATFIIDKQGNVVEKHVGYMSRFDVEEIIKGLL